MEELLNLGYSADDIKEIYYRNPSIKELDDSEIASYIQLLRSVHCKDEEILNIIYANPFFLSQDLDEVKELIRLLYSLGATALQTTFDSFPMLLTISSSMVEKFILEKRNQGFTEQEIMDMIDLDATLIEREE